MGFLGKLFTPSQHTATSFAGVIAGFLGVLASTPGGPEFIQATLAGTGKYTPLILAAVAFFGGAATGAAQAAPKA